MRPGFHVKQRSQRVFQLDLNQPKKRQRVSAQQQRRLALTLLAICVPLATAAVLIGLSVNRSRAPGAPAEHVRIVDGSVRIETSELHDGNVHIYVCYTAGAARTRFLVVERTDHTFGVALDASERSNVGFRQDAGGLKCNGCNLQFPLDDVGRRTGGCYPIPLRHALGDGNVIISADEIMSASPRFARR